MQHHKFFQLLNDFGLAIMGAAFTNMFFVELLKIIVGAAVPVVVKELWMWYKNRKTKKNAN